MKPNLSGAPLSLFSLARDSADGSAVISAHRPLPAAGAALHRLHIEEQPTLPVRGYPGMTG